MKTSLYLLCFSIAIYGCASLTNTQIESVNQYAQTTSNFSDFPSKIFGELSEIREIRMTYAANSITDPKIHISELDSIYAQKKFDDSLMLKMDVTFKVIDKYAQSLVLLSSNKYSTNIEKQAKNFGLGIDSLILLNNSINGSKKLPNGIGEAIGELVMLGGKQYIKNKQAREIKKFVGMADTLIGVMTSNLLEFLTASNLDAMIRGEEREIKLSYLAFLSDRTRTGIENDFNYLALTKRIEGVRILQQKTIVATKKLRITHKKLLTEISKRKNIKQMINELQILIEDVNGLYETCKQIDNHKS